MKPSIHVLAQRAQALSIGHMRRTAVTAAATVALAAYASASTDSRGPGTGSQPQAGPGRELNLPAPERSMVPVMNPAKAVGWPEDGKPRPADGLTVQAFARNLKHPRSMLVLPNGDVLVAESDAPQREDKGPLKERIAAQVQKRGGSSLGSADRITLLRDADGDGVAETATPFIEGIKSPFGMALVGNRLFIASSDEVLEVPYQPGQTRATGGTPTVVATVPGGPHNHHWTKGLIASRDGRRLYVSVGSNSNVAEHGMDMEVNRAAILELDIATGRLTPFATGLRNPVGMAWHPDTGALWTVVNERDELGNELVPDYLTHVERGGFYGWPYSYYGSHVDERVKPQRPDLVSRAIVPDYALGAHVAALGLAFSTGQKLGPSFDDGAFVAEHGSWNRKPRSGYEVVFVPFSQGMATGAPRTVLSGFLNDAGEALGRPAGVQIDRRGGLLVADDVGNTVWRVTGTAMDDAGMRDSAIRDAGADDSGSRGARQRITPVRR